MKCRLGGECDLVSRDYLLVSETPEMRPTVGVVQCRRCSEVYEATGWEPRTCGFCGKGYGASLHDPCLGTLPGVVRACCGHGDDRQRYAAKFDGTMVEGF